MIKSVLPTDIRGLNKAGVVSWDEGVDKRSPTQTKSLAHDEPKRVSDPVIKVQAV